MGQLGANPNKPKGCCNSTEIHYFEVLSLGKMLAQYSLVRDVPLALSFTQGKQIRWCVLFPCNLSQHTALVMAKYTSIRCYEIREHFLGFGLSSVNKKGRKRMQNWLHDILLL